MGHKDGNRELKAAFKAKKLEALVASMPRSKNELRGLFDCLDGELVLGCDHAASKTLGYRRSRSLTPKGKCLGYRSLVVTATARS